MSFSLNEVEAMARKAARGAGYEWGMAEEAGYGVRWLCANGLDGCGALAPVLDRFDGCRFKIRDIEMHSDRWRFARGPLCPMSVGTTLADHAALMTDRPLRLERVVAPVMLIPFAADIARVRGTDVQLDWNGSSVVTDGATLWGTALRRDEADVTLKFSGDRIKRQDKTDRAHPDPAVWARLDYFAARTYAPATEASRLKGAGAGTKDND